MSSATGRRCRWWIGSPLSKFCADECLGEPMQLDSDFSEFVALLAAHDVRYMIVGELEITEDDLTSPDLVIQLG